MRYSFPIASTLALLATFAPGALSAADNRAITVNSHISTQKISLNQPVHVEFTTMPRQLQNVDIAKSVANAIGVSAATTWRLLGVPNVIEHDKTHTVTVSFSLLPRQSGELGLPQIPVTWLQGDQNAELGKVTVASDVAVGGESKDIPKEVNGVAGFPWGAKISELKTVRIADNLIDYQSDRVVARPQQGLELIFRGGELCEATLAAPGLSLQQARDSFFSRWGLPQIEEPNSITWILGWTRITATPAGAESAGVRISLMREDIQSRLDQAQVKGSVFDVLEGSTPKAASAPAESDDQAKERRRKEAEEFLHQQKQDIKSTTAAAAH